MKFSIIIPLYNRPQEIEELLETLCHQTFRDFEVIVVEDGSTDAAESIVSGFADRLHLQYFFKENSGPGGSRNYGAERAKGEYLIFFDSDCLIPAHYLQSIQHYLSLQPVQVFGGPDRADPSFSPIQKAINYSMTSLFTTGGIRGNARSAEKFHPRSFNMGILKSSFDAIGGFSLMRFGEDIDLSIRMMQAGFTTALVQEAFVYHKRRTDFRKFFKQVFNSGIARINLFKRYPGSLRLVHFFPAAFTSFLILLPFSALLSLEVFLLGAILLAFYLVVLFLHGSLQNRSVWIGFLGTIASLVQLTGYGLGFIRAFYKRLILKEPEFSDFKRNFYS